MFDVDVIEKISKSGQPYTVLVITFPNGYEKTVFLDKAEQFLVSSN